MTQNMESSEVLIVVQISDVRDAARLDRYRSAAREQMIARGGTVVGRRGAMFEGDHGTSAWLVQKWPSAAAFVAWQESDEYAPLRRERREAATMSLIIVPIDIAGSTP